MPDIDPNTAALLYVFVPIVGAFLISMLFYSWINRTGRQSEGFSPVVASILTAPPLACAYFILVTTDFDNIRSAFVGISSGLILFVPVFLILTPLLIAYLCGWFRRTRGGGMILGTAFLTCLVLELLLLSVVLGHTS